MARTNCDFNKFANRSLREKLQIFTTENHFDFHVTFVVLAKVCFLSFTEILFENSVFVYSGRTGTNAAKLSDDLRSYDIVPYRRFGNILRSTRHT